jgi:NAD(P)-dependent dehydrogenase (short-subunit alcohol dehydrogenase family)
MPNNVWFVSGATSGFGKNIALEALARGDNVVATARTATSKLDDLAARGALVLDLDVMASDAELQAALDKGVERFGYLTHFINAAGYILNGPGTYIYTYIYSNLSSHTSTHVCIYTPIPAY